jgi:hypothetical protein
MKKIPGFNWLHNHPHLEKEMGMPADHVIIDRSDWKEAVKQLQENPLKESKFIVDPKRYEQLIEDQKKLNALESAGVDNWEGYDEAMEFLDDYPR